MNSESLLQWRIHPHVGHALTHNARIAPHAPAVHHPTPAVDHPTPAVHHPAPAIHHSIPATYHLRPGMDGNGVDVLNAVYPSRLVRPVVGAASRRGWLNFYHRMLSVKTRQIHPILTCAYSFVCSDVRPPNFVVSSFSPISDWLWMDAGALLGFQ